MRQQVRAVAAAAFVLSAVVMGGAPAQAQAVARTAYVANQFSDNVTPIDTATNTAGTPITVGDGPNAIAITPDGATAYVTNQISDNVTPIDTATDTAGAPIAAGDGPNAIAISPDGATAYVANLNSDTVTPIATATNTAGTPIAVGDGPRAIAITPNQGPAAAFTATTATAGSATNFNASGSSDPDGSIASYSWDFGDGQMLTSASPTPGHTYATPGTYTVTLTVIDNEGCSRTRVFTGQTVSCNGTSAARVTQQVTVTSAPSPPQHTLTVSKTGSGSGTVTGPGIDCGTDCTQSYGQSSAVTLTATPASGSVFDSWSGCDSIAADQCTVTMSAARTVTASFVAQRTLTVTKAGSGSGTVTSTTAGIDCGADCADAYADGTAVTLTASPAPGSRFDSWGGCDSSAANQCTVTMTADKAVTATFKAVHERGVSLRLRRHLVARGRVKVLDGFDACAAGVTVKIQRRTANGWVTLKKLSTRDDGRFRASLKDRTGAYRAKAPKRKREGGLDICRKARSSVGRHTH